MICKREAVSHSVFRLSSGLVPVSHPTVYKYNAFKGDKTSEYFFTSSCTSKCMNALEAEVGKLPYPHPYPLTPPHPQPTSSILVYTRANRDYM